MEEGNMNKMNTHELSARINRFIDRKMAETGDLATFSDMRSQRSHKRTISVSNSPYIQLAIK